MYQKEIDFLKEELPKAYRTFSGLSFAVSEKASFDIVTDIDQKIEIYLTEKIRAVFPQDRIHSEEFASREPLCGRTWLLDPIDGTYNFATGSPLFGIQCALWDGKAVCACAIYLPKLGEFYHAVKGEGAYCNGSRLWVKKRRAADSIVSIGDFPHGSAEDAAEQKKCMETLFPKIARFRMFGAASVDYAFVASGRTDGALLYTKNKWDLACGWLLCKEAGALVKGRKGKDYSFDSRAIFIFSDPALTNDLFKE